MDGENNKVVLYIVLIVVVFLVVDSLFGISSKRNDSDEKERERAETKERANEIRATELGQLIARGIKPSFTANKYAELAQNLYNAMKGAGTDEYAVAFNLLQMRNDADFLVLNTAFGVREGEPLSTWIRNDLSTAFIKSLNAKLLAKGITYTF